MFISSINSTYRHYSCYNYINFRHNFRYKDYFNNEINYNNLDENEINTLFSNKLKKIIGGNIYSHNFNDWKQSINIYNSIPVKYNDFKKITDFLDDKIKEKLSGPLKVIEKKYELRRKYLEIIEKLKERKKNYTIYGKFSNNNGIITTKKEPYIYSKNYKVKAEWSF